MPLIRPVHTGDKVERTFDDRATESTESATVDFAADLSPVSATVDFVASVYRVLGASGAYIPCYDRVAIRPPTTEADKNKKLSCCREAA